MPHRRIDGLAGLLAPMLRESAGRHEYDGVLPDLSPDGVARTLGRLGGPPLADPHDEAHLTAVEDGVRVLYGEVETHRRSPRPLLSALDLAGYDRPYAPREERAAARRRHLAGWPDAIDAGLSSLVAVPAPVARGLLPSVVGAVTGIDATLPEATEALAAHARLVAHLEHAAEHGDRDAALGPRALTRLLGVSEAMPVDLGAMERAADAERDRLRQLLRTATDAIDPDRPVGDVVRGLVADHPDADGVLRAARHLADEALAFTREAGLVSDHGGTCEVAPSPASRRWATAMLSWAAPYEPDGPSRYSITPPEATWSRQRRTDWLSAFSSTTLPATTVHEVAPGHFTHGRALRVAEGDVRRSLHSSTFVEGWAHYGEELMIEVGYRAGDPRFVVGVALKALLRVTRLAAAIGFHSGTLDLDDCVARFQRDAFLRPAVAEAETARATFDPTYGRYTWGKLELLRLRDRARRRWGAGFTLRRFHDAVLALGAPPLGLIDAALEA